MGTPTDREIAEQVDDEIRTNAVRIHRERADGAAELLRRLEQRPCGDCAGADHRCLVCQWLLARHRTDLTASQHQLELLGFGR